MRELLARIKARLRSIAFANPDLKFSDTSQLDTSVLVFGDLVIDNSRREVKLKGHLLTLKPKEFEVLSLLAKHQGQVLTRDFLYEHVWGFVSPKDTRSLDVHIRWLRDKIEINSSDPARILTVRGTGYRFDG